MLGSTPPFPGTAGRAPPAPHPPSRHGGQGGRGGVGKWASVPPTPTPWSNFLLALSPPPPRLLFAARPAGIFALPHPGAIRLLPLAAGSPLHRRMSRLAALQKGVLSCDNGSAKYAAMDLLRFWCSWVEHELPLSAGMAVSRHRDAV